MATGRKRATGSRTSEVDLESFRFDDGNVRLHPEANRQAVLNSLRQFGLARSIVVDKDGIVRAGNGTLEAAVKEGHVKGIQIEVDGDELVIVKRNDLSGEKAVAYAIADNRTAELSRWDKNGLSHALKSLQGEYEFQDIGFTTQQAKSLMELTEPAPDQTSELESHALFEVIVTFESEAEQVKFLERMREEGRKCTALIS